MFGQLKRGHEFIKKRGNHKTHCSAKSFKQGCCGSIKVMKKVYRWFTSGKTSSSYI
jgi:hypothetical protein